MCAYSHKALLYQLYQEIPLGVLILLGTGRDRSRALDESTPGRRSARRGLQCDGRPCCWLSQLLRCVDASSSAAHVTAGNSTATSSRVATARNVRALMVRSTATEQRIELAPNRVCIARTPIEDALDNLLHTVYHDVLCPMVVPAAPPCKPATDKDSSNERCMQWCVGPLTPRDYSIASIHDCSHQLGLVPVGCTPQLLASWLRSCFVTSP